MSVAISPNTVTQRRHNFVRPISQMDEIRELVLPVQKQESLHSQQYVLNSAREYPSTTLSSITHTAQKLRRTRMERMNSKQTIPEYERAHSMMVKKDQHSSNLEKLVSTPLTAGNVGNSIDTPFIKRTSLKEAISNTLEKTI